MCSGTELGAVLEITKSERVSFVLELDWKPKLELCYGTGLKAVLEGGRTGNLS